MKTKIKCSIFFLLISTLFALNVAIASPPTDLGGDTDTDLPAVEEDVNVNDGGGENGDGNGEDMFFEDEQEMLDEHDYAHDSGALDTDSFVIAENANIQGNDTNCANQLGEVDQQVRVRITDYNSGVSRAYAIYSMVVTTDENGNPVCEMVEVGKVRDGGCFAPETQILMGDKSLKAIKDIRKGDLVWNPSTQKAQKVANMLLGPEKLPLIEVGYASERMRITQSHPVVVERSATSGFSKVALRFSEHEGAQVIKASELREGDRILGADGAFHNISVLKEVPVQKDQWVFNFELEADSDEISQHTIVANGFISPDVRVQANLNNEKLPWDKK